MPDANAPGTPADRSNECGRDECLIRIDDDDVLLGEPEGANRTPEASNQNGHADEYEDFVQYNQKLLENYRPSEVLYIKGSGTYTIT